MLSRARIDHAASLRAIEGTLTDTEAAQSASVTAMSQHMAFLLSRTAAILCNRYGTVDGPAWPALAAASVGRVRQVRQERY